MVAAPCWTRIWMGRRESMLVRRGCRCVRDCRWVWDLRKELILVNVSCWTSRRCSSLGLHIVYHVKRS